jgi:coenzyme F420-reducing hydrogenase beta subunit
MTEWNDPSDVISSDIQVEEASVSEFEFEDGLWSLRRERNHWEIIFESEDGEEGIIVEREDFIDGKFEFEIDGSEHALPLEDFDRIDKFYYEKCAR